MTTQLSYTSPESGATVTLFFDAVLQENFNKSVYITQYPIEDGSTIADHAVSGQANINLEVFVSDTPIIVPEGQMNGVAGGVQSVQLDVPSPPQPLRLSSLDPINAAVRAVDAALSSGSEVGGVNVLKFDGQVQRVVNMFDELDYIASNALLCLVTMKIRSFDNLLIQNLSAPRSVADGSGIRFSIDLVQVDLVNSEQTSAPRPKTKRVAPPKDKGVKAPESPSEEEQTSIRQSLASKVAVGIFG